MSAGAGRTEEKVLVVDDEAPQREILKKILQSEGYLVLGAGNVASALCLLKEEKIDLVITDLKMPDSDGLSAVDRILGETSAPCIIMTAHGSIDSAVDAMKKGAFDYLTKPLDREELLVAVARGLEKVRLIAENRMLKNQLRKRFSIHNIIGMHPKMQEIFRTLEKIAPSSATILVLGESGTGKELIARAIHYNSPRKEKPFLAMNCAAIPESLIESELFGHERGAFTGATDRSIGLFEAAQEGTLFLDEIGDLSLPLQAKILRTLQEREIRRIGGREEIKVDVRVIAATNKDLLEEIKEDRFREDLYYRLNVVSLRIPSLSERSTDIPDLVRHFIRKYQRKGSSEVRGVSREALRFLMEYSWPGNVRQLESAIERAILLCAGEEIGVEDLPNEIRNPALGGKIDFEIPPGFSLEEFEKNLLVSALRKNDWVVSRAAKMLGISYRTLQYRLEKFAIQRTDAPSPN